MVSDRCSFFEINAAHFLDPEVFVCSPGYLPPWYSSGQFSVSEHRKLCKEVYKFSHNFCFHSFSSSLFSSETFKQSVFIPASPNVFYIHSSCPHLQMLLRGLVFIFVPVPFIRLAAFLCIWSSSCCFIQPFSTDEDTSSGRASIELNRQRERPGARQTFSHVFPSSLTNHFHDTGARKAHIKAAEAQPQAAPWGEE